MLRFENVGRFENSILGELQESQVEPHRAETTKATEYSLSPWLLYIPGLSARKV
jgi:hypothetical protein